MSDKLNNREIPEGWLNKQLVSFTNHIQSGGTPKSDNPNFYNGDIPFVAIDDLTSTSKYLIKTKKNITIQGLKNSAAWEVPVNSLMYSIYATLGVPRINKIKAATNQAILNIVPNDNIISLEFLYYLLLEKRSSILAHSAHTTQSNLNAKIVKELEFIFPKSLTEQKKIAEILSKVDRAIEQTQSLIDKYGRIKTGLMQDLLTKGIDENGNIRSEETHEFKDSELGSIPKEWDCLSLDKLSRLKSGGTPSRQRDDFWNGSIPWVRTAEVSYNLINNTLEKITKKGLNNSSATLFPKGTILMALYGQGRTRGRVAILDIEATTNQACVGFTNLRNIQTYFLYYLLMNEYNKLRDLSNDGAQKNLSARLLNDYIIKIPVEKKEQIKIENILLSNDEKIIVEKTKLKKLHSLKTALMQDLLSGKKRVTNLIQEEAL